MTKWSVLVLAGAVAAAFGVQGRKLALDTCTLEMSHAFGHGFCWRAMLPYTPALLLRDFPTEQGPVGEGVMLSYDTLRIPLPAAWMRTVADVRVRGEISVMYSMKISNYFDFGASGILPGLASSSGGNSATPVWSPTGALSLALYPPDGGGVSQGLGDGVLLKRNTWVTVKLNVRSNGRVRLWLNDALVADVRIGKLQAVDTLALYCERFGGRHHSVVTIENIQVWSGDCGLLRAPARPRDEL